jgi:hypothetical protein
VIADSGQWKARLQQELASLRKSLSGRDIDDSHYESVEWFVFTSAFILRKLCQSKRLSYEVERRVVLVNTYPRRKRAHRLKADEHEIMKRFSFRKGKRRSLSLEALCNQLIHSFDFLVSCEERGHARCFLFNSDRSNRHALFECRLSDYVRLIRYVSRDRWAYAVRRDPRNPDVEYDLRMRRAWSQKRMNEYFAQFGLPPMSGIGRRRGGRRLS